MDKKQKLEQLWQELALVEQELAELKLLLEAKEPVQPRWSQIIAELETLKLAIRTLQESDE